MASSPCQSLSFYITAGEPATAAAAPIAAAFKQQEQCFSLGARRSCMGLARRLSLIPAGHGAY
jgi:hypothetical protein